jgi:hypothetical protein
VEGRQRFHVDAGIRQTEHLTFLCYSHLLLKENEEGSECTLSFGSCDKRGRLSLRKKRQSSSFNPVN